MCDDSSQLSASLIKMKPFEDPQALVDISQASESARVELHVHSEIFIHFIVFADFTAALEINSSKSS